MSQFVTEDDMNRIKGLLHYMNESFGPPGAVNMAAEIKLTDSNGDTLGVIDFENMSVERYVFYHA